MKEESFDWLGKRARRTIAGLLVGAVVLSFGVNGIRSYLSNRSSRNYTNIEVSSSDVKIRAPTKQVQPEFETPEFETYIVKYGDTLSEIAEDKGVLIGEIMYYNSQITNPNKIYANQELKIPKD